MENKRKDVVEEAEADLAKQLRIQQFLMSKVGSRADPTPESVEKYYAEHPERFPKGLPKRQALPRAVYINPPSAGATEAPASGVDAVPDVSTQAGLRDESANIERASEPGGWGRAEPPVPASRNSAGDGSEAVGAGTETAAPKPRAPFAAVPNASPGSTDVELQARLQEEPVDAPSISSRRPRPRKREVALQ